MSVGLTNVQNSKALVSLFATSNGLAAKQHAPKPATSKKAESSKKAVPAADAVPPPQRVNRPGH